MTTATVQDLQRFCVKFHASREGVDDQVFVPIFHDWIRDRAFDDMILFDVADYAHVPESPGIVLVTHDAHFSLDRSDGRFGLHAQRRVSAGAADPVETLGTLVRQSLQVAERLVRDPRVQGKLAFDTATLHVESNDRLRAPNNEDGWRTFEPLVRAGVERALGKAVEVERVANDPRDRLTAQVRVAN